MNGRTTYPAAGVYESARGWLRWLLERPARIAAAVAAVLLVAGLAVWALRPSAVDAVSLGAAAQGPTLELLEQDVATVEVRPLARSVPITGTVQPRDWTEVKAQVAGEISGVAVRSGDKVKHGQVLAR